MGEHPPRPSFSRRRVVQQLAAGGAIVWTAPLIAKTAYAASAASCTDRVLSWNAFTAGSTFSSTTIAGVTVTLGPSTFYGGSSALGTNRTIRSGPQGGVPGNALRLEQTPVNGGGQIVTFTFSQQVFNVTFTVTDLDNVAGNWSDRLVVLDPATFTGSAPAGSTVIGAGTASGNQSTTGPYRNSQADNNIPNTSNAGNIRLTFPGPLTQVQLRYVCASPSGGQNQLVNITNIGFCA